MFELTDQMYNAVLTLDEDYRQFFCLQKCQEQGSLYLLKEPGADGMPLMFNDEAEEDDDESTLHNFLPIWCHPKFAEYYREHADNAQELAQYELIEMKLEVFKSHWGPALEQNKVALALMPLADDKNFTLCRATIFAEENPAAVAAKEAGDSDKLSEDESKSLSQQKVRT